MISVDGSMGEGGGQIVRTSVALSALLQKPVRVSKIRAGREKPGLNYQHVTAIKAVGNLCDAEIKGLEIGSRELEFTPNEIRGANLHIDVGTAGSVTLVMQSLMLASIFAPKEVTIEIQGGTDVRWSPSIDYLMFVTLPILKRFGYDGDIRLLRRGYYPKGGGKVSAVIRPSKLEKINLAERGGIKTVGGVSHSHRDLEKARVSRRQAKIARPLIYNELSNSFSGFDGNVSIGQEYADVLSYGSGITLWAEAENSVVGASSLGERGKRAEVVGREAAEQLLKEINSDAALDRFMADQIVPYIALFGGSAKVSQMTEHAKTNIKLMEIFGHELEISGNTIRNRKNP